MGCFGYLRDIVMFKFVDWLLVLAFCWLNGLVSWCLWLVLLVAFTLIVLYTFFDVSLLFCFV